MFSQKRKNYWWIWVILIGIIIILSVLIALAAIRSTDLNGQPSSEPADKPVNVQVPENNNSNSEDKDDINDNTASYYLIKYDGEAVKVMFYDKEGTEVEIETTSIIFETLSEEDQKRFKEGIKVDDREALNRIIMDYES